MDFPLSMRSMWSTSRAVTNKLHIKSIAAERVTHVHTRNTKKLCIEKSILFAGVALID